MYQSKQMKCKRKNLAKCPSCSFPNNEREWRRGLSSVKKQSQTKIKNGELYSKDTIQPYDSFVWTPELNLNRYFLKIFATMLMLNIEHKPYGQLYDSLIMILFHRKKENDSYRFGGKVNDDGILIFSWTNTLFIKQQGTHSGCRVQHGSAPVLGLHSAGPHGLCAAMKETACCGSLITTTRPENERQKDARLSKGCVLIFQSGSYLIHLLSMQPVVW